MGQHGSSSPVFVPHSKLNQGKYGRLFRNLPVWAPNGDAFFKLDSMEQEQLVSELVLDDLKMTGTSAGANDENPDIPAAYTYFGQFVDHDITFDPMSRLARENDPDQLVNFRTPRLDLDNIYGRGPADQPYMYEGPSDEAKFRIGDNGHGEDDLPRIIHDDPGTQPREGVALIGDKRNDENIIVSQFQLAMLKLHNVFIDEVKAEGKPPNSTIFKEAQRRTRWYYQWVVIKDFLVRLCGPQTISRMLNQTQGNSNEPYEGPNLKIYNYKHNPFMPVEFSGGAYRLGHTMVRDGYNLSDKLDGFTGGNEIPIFVAKTDKQVGELEDLRGFRRLPGVWTIQWDKFVEFDGSSPQLSMALDMRLSDPLENLPEVLNTGVAAGHALGNLAIRNILRGIALGLPSGQAVAKRMGFAPLSGQELPLWAYVLKEARQSNQGKSLGPVGSRIVGEVMIGILASDPCGYLDVEPEWKPQEILDGAAKFELADLLAKAGAPMTASDPVFNGGATAP